MPFATISIDLEIIILSKINKKEKDKYHMISLICGLWEIKQISKQNKIETDSWIQRSTWWLPEGIRTEGLVK